MALNVRTLIVIGTVSACWAFSFGLGTQAVSHWLKSLELRDTTIGLNHSCYYFGLAVASFLVPAMTRRLGAVHCASLGMFLSAGTLAAFPWVDGEAAWYALRFFNGWAGAMSLVPLETLVSQQSAPESKTLNFGIYGVSLTLGGAFGIGLAPQCYGLGFPVVFALGSCLPLLAGVALSACLRPLEIDSAETEAPASLGFRRNFLSYGTAGAQGFLEGGMLAFLALFLQSRGFSPEHAGSLVSVATVGVLLFQVPISWAADRVGKTPMLLACHALVVLGLIAIPCVNDGILLAVFLFAFGGFSGAMYPLGLSLLSDRMPAQALARAYAWYLAIECVGSQTGAAAMGAARDHWGERSMFFVGLVPILLVLAGWTGLLARSRRSANRLPTAAEVASYRRAA